MIKILKIFTTCLLLLVFFAATTGVSMYTHRCGQSKHADVAIYPEIFNTKLGCCSPYPYQKSMNCDNGNHATKTPGLAKTRCCQLSHQFIKITSAFQLVPRDFFKIANQALPDISQAVKPISLNIFKVSRYYMHCYFPPPAYGKFLVYFIQQIKIPLPS